LPAVVKWKSFVVFSFDPWGVWQVGTWVSEGRKVLPIGKVGKHKA
jgi:hypothetical protein